MSAEKPLGVKAYGSLPHLPGSRRGPGDRGLTEQQARILTDKERDRHDIIICQQKVDGSNVAVAKLTGGEIVAINRAGYRCWDSPWAQHRHFALWVGTKEEHFGTLLNPGERVVGEWLLQTHGTRYALRHAPFVPFDIFRHDNERICYLEFRDRVLKADLTPAQLIAYGKPISIADAMKRVDPAAHGALDSVEGCVWRVERKSIVDFLGKYVQPDKKDGLYLPGTEGAVVDTEIWNEGAATYLSGVVWP